MQCPNCGYEARTAGRFCARCGRDLALDQPNAPRPLNEYRRAKSARHTRRRIAGFVVPVMIVGVLAAGGIALARLRNNSSSNTPHAAAKSTPTHRGATTTTEPLLEERSYDKGDCVNWDPLASGARATTVVSCDKVHIVEISGSVDVTRFTHYATTSDWDHVRDVDCAPLNTALIGGPIDPQGRFGPTILDVRREDWDRGERTVWCGIGATPDKVPSSPVLIEEWPFAGKVEGVSQARTEAIGSCMSRSFAWPIPCSQPHQWEVTGYVDLSGRTTPPPAPNDDAAWDALVGNECQQRAQTYLGHATPAGVQAGWFPLEPESWTAGRRTVECLIDRVHNGQTETINVSLKQ